MSKQQAWILIVVAVVAVGALVQMNRYKYSEQSFGEFTYIIRIDRFTGQQCLESVPMIFRSVPGDFNLPNLPLC